MTGAIPLTENSLPGSPLRLSLLPVDSVLGGFSGRGRCVFLLYSCVSDRGHYVQPTVTEVVLPPEIFPQRIWDVTDLTFTHPPPRPGTLAIPGFASPPCGSLMPFRVACKASCPCTWLPVQCLPTTLVLLLLLPLPPVHGNFALETVRSCCK